MRSAPKTPRRGYTGDRSGKFVVCLIFDRAEYNHCFIDGRIVILDPPSLFLTLALSSLFWVRKVPRRTQSISRLHVELDGGQS